MEKLDLEVLKLQQQTLTFASLQTMAETVRVYYQEKLKQELGIELVSAEQ